MSGVTVEGLTVSFGGEKVLTGVDLDVGSGEALAVLGPSGSGKTTLLRVVAGLQRPDLGRVSAGGRVLNGPGVHVAPEDRRMGMVFQNGALFPHLDVARNVGFGLPKGQRRESPRIGEALEMVGLAGYGSRRTDTLSGGQAQRVALARALAPRPEILLLDEPFSNLDARLRSQVRRDTDSLLRTLGVTTLFVTHDQDEAFLVGDRVAVLHGGRIEQLDRPDEVYRRPATEWVATFVGDADFVAGVVSEGVATTTIGAFGVDTPDGPCRILVRPDDLRIEIGDTVEGADATVGELEVVGGSVTTTLRFSDGQELRARTVGVPEHRVGDVVRVVRRAAHPVVCFPAVS